MTIFSRMHPAHQSALSDPKWEDQSARKQAANPGGNSPPRSGVSMLTAWFFARALRRRMAVGRVTAGILPLAKRGEERRGSRAAFWRVAVERVVNHLSLSSLLDSCVKRTILRRNRFLCTIRIHPQLAKHI